MVASPYMMPLIPHNECFCLFFYNHYYHQALIEYMAQTLPDFTICWVYLIKKSMRLLKWLLGIIVVLAIIYLLGPNPSTPVYDKTLPSVPQETRAVEAWLAAKEASHKVKPDNEARIVWANDSLKTKTPYAIVYLHGYSASQEEGNPIHRTIASRYGCNLLLTRLAEHGLDTTDPMINLTADAYWESAKEALAIGKQLGDTVILMGTSTGGTNALQLAAAYPDAVYALVLMSPNIAINNDKAYLLNNPWGLQIAKLVTGDTYVTASDARPVYQQYWYYHYPMQSTIQLQEMLETSMTPETFKQVKQPVLMLYYYKDSIHQDSVVSVPAMLTMFEQLGSAVKVKQAIPGAGDHVIGSHIKSKDLENVRKAIELFMEQHLRLKPVSRGDSTVATTQ